MLHGVHEVSCCLSHEFGLCMFASKYDFAKIDQAHCFTLAYSAFVPTYDQVLLSELLLFIGVYKLDLT